MSTDPKANFRLPVVGAETAPSEYVDYLYWAIHATGPDSGSHPVVSLTMGRWVEVPPAIPTTPQTEPESAKRQVHIAFVATLAPETLRRMRDDIDGILAAIEEAEKNTRAASPAPDPEKLN